MTIEQQIHRRVYQIYEKLKEGIVPTDISAFNNDVGYITNAVDDLINYYLKSETYTKSEVDALIQAIEQFHYEVYASTSEVTTPASNVLYLIGPTGSGSDKYDEYIYTNSTWTKIGDTSVDLSGYVTTQDLNTALSAYTVTTDLTTMLAGKVNGTGVSNIVKLTQSAFDALVTKDASTVYLVNKPQALANGVYILYTDGSLSNYDTLDAGKTAVGPVLKTDNVCFVINPNQYTGDWYREIGHLIDEVTTIPKNSGVQPTTDFNGYNNTNAVLASEYIGTAFTAASNAIYADGRHGYLPACGELEEIRLNIENINTAISLIGGTLISFNTMPRLWTSTQISANQAWEWNHNDSIWEGEPKYVSQAVRSVSTYTPSNYIYKLYLGNILIADSSTLTT